MIPALLADREILRPSILYFMIFYASFAFMRDKRYVCMCKSMKRMRNR